MNLILIKRNNNEISNNFNFKLGAKVKFYYANEEKEGILTNYDILNKSNTIYEVTCEEPNGYFMCTKYWVQEIIYTNN